MIGGGHVAATPGADWWQRPMTSPSWAEQVFHEERLRTDRRYRRAQGRDRATMHAVADDLGADPYLTVADVREAFTRHKVEFDDAEAHEVLDDFDRIRCSLMSRKGADLAVQRAEAARDGYTVLWRHAAFQRARRTVPTASAPGSDI